MGLNCREPGRALEQVSGEDAALGGGGMSGGQPGEAWCPLLTAASRQRTEKWGK